MSEATSLRAQAQTVASPLPALLAQATYLASTVLLGDHGRKRAGMGDSFWQYRPAQAGDGLRAIDWRRSARSDDAFVQDKEWQIAQSVMIWVDGSAAMSFRSDERLATKVDRARTLALATAILLNKGGERFGLTGDHLPPSRGNQQIEKMAQRLFDPDPADFGSPATGGMSPHSRALFVSDFLGDFSATQAALTKAADKGVQGVILQVLDPQEETFPFHGRTVFHSMTGGTQHETLKADALKSRYLDRLAARKDALQSLARTTGWQFQTHHTDQSAMTALLWLYQSLAGQR